MTGLIKAILVLLTNIYLFLEVQPAKAFLFVDTTTGELTSGGMNAGQDILYHEDFWLMQNTFKRLETRIDNLEGKVENLTRVETPTGLV